LDSYAAFVSNVKAILKNSSVEPKDITAVCLDAATHTAVLLDENDNIVRNCIYWTDKRSNKESEYLYKNHLDDILGECYNARVLFGRCLN
jgi:xylulokinase